MSKHPIVPGMELHSIRELLVKHQKATDAPALREGRR